MIYRCMSCGAIVYEPRMIHRVEDVDGELHFEDWYEEHCPECGEEQLEEYEEEDENESV